MLGDDLLILELVEVEIGAEERALVAGLTTAIVRLVEAIQHVNVPKVTILHQVVDTDADQAYG